jgi:plasmid replication initiation protein
MVEQGEQLQLELEDTFMVVQDNSLIMANYNMTALEQKVFLIMLSTIKKDTKNLMSTSFRVKDIADLLRIAPEPLYRDLPKVCKSIVGKVVEIKKSNGDWEIFNIVSYAKYKNKQGLITLEINSKAEPYLLELKDFFTAFQLRNALNLDSKYSIRLYQLSKSNIYRKSFVIELDDLKEKLKLTQKSYNLFSNIRTKVLEPAIEEINQKTDINIGIEYIKAGKSVNAIKFNLKQTNSNYQKVIYTSQLSKSNIKNGGFNNFEPRQHTSRYNYLLEQCSLGYATEEEQKEFDKLRGVE